VIRLNINDRPVEVDDDPAMPLLWVLRDVLGLTGTKYGCGAAMNGSVCRCATYYRIRAAIHDAAKALSGVPA
jgi:aerobic-type carbon monoxide dehydrogenase small subunit (CoxS/CutS family)